MQLDCVRFGQCSLRPAAQPGQPLDSQPIAGIDGHRLGIKAPGGVLVIVRLGDLAKAEIRELRPRSSGGQCRPVIPARFHEAVLAAVDIGAVVERGGQRAGPEIHHRGIVLGGIVQPVQAVQQKAALQQGLRALLGWQGMGFRWRP